METSGMTHQINRSFQFAFCTVLQSGVSANVPVRTGDCVQSICDIPLGTARISLCWRACLTVGMQCASLNQTPGRQVFLARGANIQRAHTRTPLLRICAAVDAHVQTNPQCRAEERKTYLGEKFWQIQPLRDGQQADYRDPDSKNTPPKIRLTNLNHVALEAADPLGLTDFYTRVLGFNSISRPDFPFKGSWLEGAGLLVHIIEEDPSVPKRIHNWKVKYGEAPESWFIRRANHLAFEAEDSDAMEERLAHFGIEYTKAIVPGANVAQLFFYDPEGHGIEVGCDYAKVADMLNSKSSTNEAAVAP